MTSIKKKQPNSRMCFICGLENPIGLKLKIYQTSPGVIETTYTAPDHFQGYPGILHGGIVASILDEISGRTLMGEPSSPRFMFTGRLQVKYRKNVPTGKPLRIIGKAIRSKGKTAEGWAGIYDQAGDLLAEASTLLIDLPKETIDTANLDELGWKVYPD
jgi:acyl-coenzyme A thioesterase PaaI-like protein